MLVKTKEHIPQLGIVLTVKYHVKGKKNCLFYVKSLIRIISSNTIKNIVGY